jgi:hypothetical protein
LKWNEAFAALQAFKKREGHCLVKSNHKEAGIKLGSWVNEQRLNAEKLSPDRIKRLDQIGFSWSPRKEQWEAAYSELITVRKRKGHCRVAQSTIAKGIRLGVWVSVQRSRKHLLSSDQIARLDSVDFSWDPHEEHWEYAFSILQDFFGREGHCNVAQSVSVKGFKLGAWVITQRHKKKNLAHSRVARLNSLGFNWDPLKEQWDRAFSVLMGFQKREGHCRVPDGHIENNFGLGAWVKKQRSRKSKLTTEKIRLLDSLSFIWKAR